MFQNVNFSFLCALAFISWSLLCYLHAIEEQQILSDYKVELYTERPIFQEISQDCEYKSSHSYLGYEMLISYGIVLTTTVALSKLLQWLELQARIHILRDVENRFEEECTSFVTLPTMVKTKSRDEYPHTARENSELKEQLNNLHNRCKELLHELRAVNVNQVMVSATDLNCYASNSNSSFEDYESTECYSDSDDNSGVILWKQPAIKSSGLSVREATPLTQNIYVTHRHLHINFNGNLHLSDNINFRSFCQKRPSEFVQVWSKYIQGPTERPMIMGINNVLM